MAQAKKAKNEGFTYTAEQRDKDATNARSAAFRSIREAAGLPVDDKNSLTPEAKKIHAECGAAARAVVATVEKGLKQRKKREEWTDEQTTKAHRLMAEKGVEAYRTAIEALGYEISDDEHKAAMVAYEGRLVERRAQAEAAHLVSKGVDYDDIFG